jgi:hypothetical protein
MPVRSWRHKIYDEAFRLNPNHPPQSGVLSCRCTTVTMKLVWLCCACCAAAVAVADPLFNELAKVKFINSGTVKATDSFVWGITTSSRNPLTSAANDLAGKVLYLEKYNVTCAHLHCTDTSWGLGGKFPYLWQKNETISSDPTCTSQEPAHHMDTSGTIVASHNKIPSWEACRQLCCANKDCGSYTYVNGSKASSYQDCFLRNMNSKVVPSGSCVATNPTYDCYSGARANLPTCVTTAPLHHMDTGGAGIGSHANVSSWQACRSLCCADSKCGTYTYVNGSKAGNYKECYLRDMNSRPTSSPNCDVKNPTFDCYSGERPGLPPVPTPAPTPVPLGPIMDPPSGMRSAGEWAPSVASADSACRSLHCLTCAHLL